MLQIKDISKEYITGDLVQKALDHVSLNLRDNEFVAVLGPSGSGKTTLLNIVGGLDRYDTGDLIINGISTKKYKDRDWDSYRNHTIGFVFQSYNLIPHQSVLSNVELALTISGISGKERRQRSIEALKKVGLEDQIYKKPNQMSGGQMQRVALARALVNDPDILLADEPTGALDTETSLQVMALLKEVAKDRLVVMVTHNPDLADQYATRIVKLKDGKITADSDPYAVDDETLPEPSYKNMGKSSMSLFTSLALSFNNLRTKKARTILVAFAGSVGIIGIALIESLSNGVNTYIHNIEEETLSEYPLEINGESFSMASLMGNAADSQSSSATIEEGKVGEADIVTNMLSSVGVNDLTSLKAYFESGDTNIEEYANAIEYGYDVTPQIYRLTDDSYRQINPNTSFSSLGISSSSTMMSLSSSSMSVDIFSELPQDSSLYENQYEVKAGRWPSNANETVLVLGSRGNVSDLLLYETGLKNTDSLDEMIKQFSSSEDINVNTETSEYSYDDFLNLSFKLVNSCNYYTYDSTNNVWIDRSSDTEYMKTLVNNGEDIKVVGIVQPKEGESVSMLTTGIYYTSALTEKLMNEAADSEVAKAQQADKTKDIFTGKDFGDESNKEVDMSNIFQIDSSAMQNAITVDTSALNVDTSSLSSIDLSGLNVSDYLDTGSLSSSTGISEDQIGQMIAGVNVSVNQEKMKAIYQALFTDFETYLNTDVNKKVITDSLSTSFTSFLSTENIPDKVKTSLQNQMTDAVMERVISSAANTYISAHPEDTGYTGFKAYLESADGIAVMKNALVNEFNQMDFSDISTAVASDYATYLSTDTVSADIVTAMQSAFNSYLSTPTAQGIIAQGVTAATDTTALKTVLTQGITQMMGSMTSSMSESISTAMQKYSTALSETITAQMTSSLSNMSNSIASGMANAIHVDTDAFKNAIQINSDQSELTSMMSAMMSNSSTTYAKNMSSIGYADKSEPSSITIYPKDFESKEKIIDILDTYNSNMTAAGSDDKVITYTDIVGVLMSSVTDIINAISYILIAFVAISLVVSSIMIGVITYISVLERQKEIGILRAIGASKHNISSIFNAETFITGLLAGLMGIGITELLLIPANIIIQSLTGQNIVASIPLNAALFLILLSVLLTMLGGLIPSKKAAHSDPVKALRSE